MNVTQICSYVFSQKTLGYIAGDEGYLSKFKASVVTYTHHYLQRLYSAMTGEDHQILLTSQIKERICTSAKNEQLRSKRTNVSVVSKRESDGIAAEPKFSGREVKCIFQNFTYYIKGEEYVSSITIAERNIAAKDVVTVNCKHQYYPVVLGTSSCREALGYQENDVIRHEDSEHECGLHQPQYPNIMHVHFKVEKGELNNFVKTIFERHVNDRGFADKYYQQFIYSRNHFKEQK